MILLPKGRGEYRGIGLVEVRWKSITSIINTCLRVETSLHDTVHGFRQGRGVGKSTLEAKPAQKLTGFCH